MHACNGLSLEMRTIGISKNLQYHVHHYYWFERLQQIYDNNIFLVIQDQIQYDGITHPPCGWKKQAGHPKKKWFWKQSKFLHPGDSPII